MGVSGAAGVATVIIAAAGTTYTVMETEKQNKKADEQSKVQQERADQLQKEAAQEKANEVGMNEREARKAKLKSDIIKSGGRRETILTNGLGEMGGGASVASGQSKTVLGG